MSLVHAVLDVRLDKGDQLSDWTRRPLPASARTYAAGDVVHLLPLAAALRAQIEELGRTDWLAAETELLLRTPSRDADPDAAWWRIKGARSLRGRRACVAQAVAAWRERRAQETDRPARFVMSDLALAAVVQRPPSTLDDLGGFAGRGVCPAWSDAASSRRSRQGEAMDRAELREPPRHGDEPGLDAAVGLLAGWTAQIAAGERVDARLLATREDVKAVVNGRPSRLDDGWRAAMVGEDLHALVHGDAVIRLVGGGRRLSLERRPDRSG